MSPADGLQFQTAEFSGRTCTVCQTTIGSTYYQIQGRDACPNCAQARLSAQSLPDSGGKMLKALLWGGGAAIVGSAAFAAVALMGMRLAILSIGVGWLIGTAIKKGTDGHTSRKYQVIAVLLTYLAIATSYVPLVVMEMSKMKEKRAATGGAGANSVTVDGDATPKRAPVSGGSALLALVVAAGFVVALPLLDSFGRMPGGLLTLLIIFFGLQQAWKQTAPDLAVVVGPYPNTAS